MESLLGYPTSCITDLSDKKCIESPPLNIHHGAHCLGTDHGGRNYNKQFRVVHICITPSYFHPSCGTSRSYYERYKTLLIKYFNYVTAS